MSNENEKKDLNAIPKDLQAVPDPAGIKEAQLPINRQKIVPPPVKTKPTTATNTESTKLED